MMPATKQRERDITDFTICLRHSKLLFVARVMDIVSAHNPMTKSVMDPEKKKLYYKPSISIV